MHHGASLKESILLPMAATRSTLKSETEKTIPGQWWWKRTILRVSLLGVGEEGQGYTPFTEKYCWRHVKTAETVALWGDSASCPTAASERQPMLRQMAC